MFRPCGLDNHGQLVQVDEQWLLAFTAFALRAVSLVSVGDIIPLVEGKAIDKATVIQMIKKDVSILRRLLGALSLPADGRALLPLERATGIGTVVRQG